MSERVGRDAVVLAEVVVVGDVDAETEGQRVIALVVRLDAMLHRTGDAPAVLLPVVDGVRERRDGALEDCLAARLLSDTAIRHLNLRRDWQRTVRHFNQLPKLCVKISILMHRRMWVRSFSTRLTSVTFAEDKVLIFLILRKNAKIVQL